MDTLQLESVGLEFADFVAAAGIPISLAQNWTNGRPLRIRASISDGNGRGTRKVFSIFDAYLTAYLDVIRRRGLSTGELKRIHDFLTLLGSLKGQQLSEFFNRKDLWLVLSITPLAIKSESVRHIEGSLYEPSPMSLNPGDDFGLQVAVDVISLMDGVDSRALAALKEKGRLQIGGAK